MLLGQTALATAAALNLLSDAGPQGLFGPEG